MDELGRWITVAEKISDHLFSLQDIQTQDKLKEKSMPSSSVLSISRSPHVATLSIAFRDRLSEVSAFVLPRWSAPLPLLTDGLGVSRRTPW